MNSARIDEIVDQLHEVITEGEATAYTIAVYHYAMKRGCIERDLPIESLQPYLTIDDERLAKEGLELLCSLICRMGKVDIRMVEALQQPLSES